MTIALGPSRTPFSLLRIGCEIGDLHPASREPSLGSLRLDVNWSEARILDLFAGLRMTCALPGDTN